MAFSPIWRSISGAPSLKRAGQNQGVTEGTKLLRGAANTFLSQTKPLESCHRTGSRFGSVCTSPPDSSHTHGMTLACLKRRNLLLPIHQRFSPLHLKARTKNATLFGSDSSRIDPGRQAKCDPALGEGTSMTNYGHRLPLLPKNLPFSIEGLGYLTFGSAGRPGASLSDSPRIAVASSGDIGLPAESPSAPQPARLMTAARAAKPEISFRTKVFPRNPIARSCPWRCSTGCSSKPRWRWRNRHSMRQTCPFRTWLPGRQPWRP